MWVLTHSMFALLWCQEKPSGVYKIKQTANRPTTLYAYDICVNATTRQQISVYSILIVICLFVPRRVKNVPPLFQMWGVQKFCPPTFKTVAPPLTLRCSKLQYQEDAASRPTEQRSSDRSRSTKTIPCQPIVDDDYWWRSKSAAHRRRRTSVA